LQAAESAGSAIHNPAILVTAGGWHQGMRSKQSLRGVDIVWRHVE